MKPAHSSGENPALPRIEKRRGWLLAAAFLVAASTGTSADLTLAANALSAYQVVLPDSSPTPAVGDGLRQVARLVQTAFKANGCDVPIVIESERDPERPGIFLGNTLFARKPRPDPIPLKIEFPTSNRVSYQ